MGRLYPLLGLLAVLARCESLDLQKDLDAIDLQISGLKVAASNPAGSSLGSFLEQHSSEAQKPIKKLKKRLEQPKDDAHDDDDVDGDEDSTSSGNMAQHATASTVPPNMLSLDNSAGLAGFQSVESQGSNVQTTLMQIAQRKKHLAQLRRNAKSLAKQIEQDSKELKEEKATLKKQSAALLESVNKFTKNIVAPPQKSSAVSRSKKQHDQDIQNAVKIATQAMQIKHLKNLLLAKSAKAKPVFITPVKPSNQEELQEAHEAAMEKATLISSLKSEMSGGDGLSYLDTGSD